MRRLVPVTTVPHTTHLTGPCFRKAASIRPISDRCFLDTMTLHLLPLPHVIITLQLHSDKMNLWPRVTYPDGQGSGGLWPKGWAPRGATVQEADRSLLHAGRPALRPPDAGGDQ